MSNAVDQALLERVICTVATMEHGPPDTPILRVIHDMILALALFEEGVTKDKAVQIITQYRKEEIEIGLRGYPCPYAEGSYPYLRKLVDLVGSGAFRDAVVAMESWYKIMESNKQTSKKCD